MQTFAVPPTSGRHPRRDRPRVSSARARTSTRTTRSPGSTSTAAGRSGRRSRRWSSSTPSRASACTAVDGAGVAGDNGATPCLGKRAGPGRPRGGGRLPPPRRAAGDGPGDGESARPDRRPRQVHAQRPPRPALPAGLRADRAAGAMADRRPSAGPAADVGRPGHDLQPLPPLLRRAGGAAREPDQATGTQERTTGAWLVPDVRWFPTTALERTATATMAVRALLEGPSQWLAGAVTTRRAPVASTSHPSPACSSTPTSPGSTSPGRARTDGGSCRRNSWPRSRRCRWSRAVAPVSTVELTVKQVKLDIPPGPVPALWYARRRRGAAPRAAAGATRTATRWLPAVRHHQGRGRADAVHRPGELRARARTSPP